MVTHSAQIWHKCVTYQASRPPAVGRRTPSAAPQVPWAVAERDFGKMSQICDNSLQILQYIDIYAPKLRQAAVVMFIAPPAAVLWSGAEVWPVWPARVWDGGLLEPTLLVTPMSGNRFVRASHTLVRVF